MRPNRFTIKSFAIILLLVFSQKVGGGLYLHNWLHQKNCTQSSHSAGTIVSGVNCSCIDDFSMPFTENPEKVSQPFSSIEVEYNYSYKSLIPLSSTFFYSLRAPPFFS